MNTVITPEQNSLEQDKSVNPEQTQFTSAQGSQNSHQLRLCLSSIHRQAPKKDAKLTDVKISTQDVHVYYGETEAIKGIDLNIYANEVIAFIGPSGCGKLTFLRTLNRMNDTI